jgi:hypothetical protein
LWHSQNKDNIAYIKRNEKIGNSKLGTKSLVPVWNKGMTGETYLNHYIKNGVNTLYLALEKQKNTWYKKTSIEQKMENLLIELNIKYKYSCFLFHKQFDFQIYLDDNKKYFIEVDGDYYHKSSRRCFDENERKITRMQDKTKENILYENFGNENCIVVRFWEFNINNHIDIIKNLLIDLKNKNNKEKTINKIKQFYKKFQ